MSQSCNILNCDKVFNSLAALTKHQSSVHYCGHAGCSQVSADMAGQKEHNLNVHRKIKKSFGNVFLLEAITTLLKQSSQEWI